MRFSRVLLTGFSKYACVVTVLRSIPALSDKVYKNEKKTSFAASLYLLSCQAKFCSGGVSSLVLYLYHWELIPLPTLSFSLWQSVFLLSSGVCAHCHDLVVVFKSILVPCCQLPAANWILLRALHRWINVEPCRVPPTASVADPPHFDADLYPDPACHFDADPDPGGHFDADPDPDPTFHTMRIPCILACHLQIDADPKPDPTFKLMRIHTDLDPNSQHCLLHR